MTDDDGERLFICVGPPVPPGSMRVITRLDAFDVSREGAGHLAMIFQHYHDTGELPPLVEQGVDCG